MIIAVVDAQTYPFEFKNRKLYRLFRAHSKAQFPFRADTQGLFFRMEKITDPFQEREIRDMELEIERVFFKIKLPQGKVSFNRVHQECNIFGNILVG